MLGLLNLPMEVLSIIVEISELPQLAALARTNKSLYSLANSTLYRQDNAHEEPKALLWAARCERLETFRKAIAAWGDIDAPNKKDMRALHYTAHCYGKIVDEMINYLVNLGASLDDVYDVETPLELACKFQNCRAAIALIRAGAELKADLLTGCVSSIKAKAAGGCIPDKYTEEFETLQRTLISDLVQRGADLNRSSGHGDDAQTALMRAVSDGEVSTVQLLLDLGANVNARGGNDTTALMCAVENRKVQCVEMLIAAGADVTLVDRDGASSLYTLPPTKIEKDTAKIWVDFLQKGFDVEFDSWFPEHGHVSMFELAVYEALQGRSLALRLIMDHSIGVQKSSIWKVKKALNESGYNPERFLQGHNADSMDEKESEGTLKDLYQRSGISIELRIDWLPKH